MNGRDKLTAALAEKATQLQTSINIPQLQTTKRKKKTETALTETLIAPQVPTYEVDYDQLTNNSDENNNRHTRILRYVKDQITLYNSIHKVKELLSERFQINFSDWTKSEIIDVLYTLDVDVLHDMYSELLARGKWTLPDESRYHIYFKGEDEGDNIPDRGYGAASISRTHGGLDYYDNLRDRYEDGSGATLPGHYKVNDEMYDVLNYKMDKFETDN